MTVHLRGKIQKRARKRPPPNLNAASERGTASDDIFKDTELHPWFRIPEDLTEDEKDVKDEIKFSPEEAFPKATSPTSDGGSSETNAKREKFCSLLKGVAQDFQETNRPYCALSAKHAIALTRKDEQDDINPGLWQYIREKEEELEKSECERAEPENRATGPKT